MVPQRVSSVQPSITFVVCCRPVVSGGDIAGAWEVVAVPGVVVERMRLLRQKCSADHPVGVEFLLQVPEDAMVGPRMERCVD